jgi:hypothetical protein
VFHLAFHHRSEAYPPSELLHQSYQQSPRHRLRLSPHPRTYSEVPLVKPVISAENVEESAVTLVPPGITVTV